MVIDPDVMAFTQELDRVVAGETDGGLVGTYVHGSVALGGFVPGRSDVDVLFVVRGLGSSDATQLGRALVARADGCPGRGLEASVVSLIATLRPGPPWPFLVHVATDRTGDRLVLGAGHRGDPDLLLHYVVSRAAAHAISGPPAGDVFGPIDRGSVLLALADELDDAIENGTRAYAVLNACRAWQYAATGSIVSKLDGAAWALERTTDVSVVRRALSEQTGRGRRADSTRCDEADERFVRHVIRRLAWDEPAT